MISLTVPAKYQREIEAAIRRAVRFCESDAKLRDGSEPFPHGILMPWELDEAATGEIVITISDVAQERSEAA